MKAIGQYLLFILYCIFNVVQGGFTFLSFWMKHQCVTIQNEMKALSRSLMWYSLRGHTLPDAAKFEVWFENDGNVE